MNLVEKIVDYESGLMDDADIFVFFQELVDTGLVGKLQGRYGRVARLLIDAGEVTETEGCEMGQLVLVTKITLEGFTEESLEVFDANEVVYLLKNLFRDKGVTASSIEEVSRDYVGGVGRYQVEERESVFYVRDYTPQRKYSGGSKTVLVFGPENEERCQQVAELLNG